MFLAVKTTKGARDYQEYDDASFEWKWDEKLSEIEYSNKSSYPSIYKGKSFLSLGASCLV
jgi:hypothetical protein